MVDHPGREFVEIEVGDAVGTYDHRAFLLAEGFDEAADRVGAGIHVIGIELYREASAARVVYRGVPVAAYGVVAPGLMYHHQAPVTDAVQQLRRTVGGVVVDHYHVEAEIRPLGERRPHRILYRTHAVPAWNHHRSFAVKAPVLLRIRKVDAAELGLQPAAHGLQMLRAGLFHLDLHRPVAGVHIVEQLLSRLAGVQFHFVIEIFVDMHEIPLLRKLEPEVIQAGEFIIGLHPRCGLPERGAADEHHPAEIEVVAERTFLPVYDGSLGSDSVRRGEMVRIDHRRTRVLRHLEHPFETMVHPLERGRPGI